MKLIELSRLFNSPQKIAALVYLLQSVLNHLDILGLLLIFLYNIFNKCLVDGVGNWIILFDSGCWRCHHFSSRKETGLQKICHHNHNVEVEGKDLNISPVLDIALIIRNTNFSLELEVWRSTLELNPIILKCTL